MHKISIISDNIVSPLGFTTLENIEALKEGRSGLSTVSDSLLGIEHHSGIINKDAVIDKFGAMANAPKFTPLEQAAILSINDAISSTSIDSKDKDLLFILSTTKGNISLIDPAFHPQINRKRIYLQTMADTLCQHFGFVNKPMVISNACISGIVGLIIAKRLIEANRYKHVVLVGCDEVSKFTLSGFSALKALSPSICRPFDRDRVGINIGEAAGTIILSESDSGKEIDIIGGAVTNDANHISGPSRDGEGMARSILQSIGSSDIEIDMVSAHGTATRYNDDMEALAFETVGITDAKINSLKGYWGHTLGAAGILESIASYSAIVDGYAYKSLGFENQGTPIPLNISTEGKATEINTVLKTGSGFGGCNASIIFRKR